MDSITRLRGAGRLQGSSQAGSHSARHRSPKKFTPFHFDSLSSDYSATRDEHCRASPAQLLKITSGHSIFVL
jgi:hypothetical protein